VAQAPVPAGETNKVRLALGLVGARQDDLATATGIDAGNLSQILNGKKPMVALVTCQRIARAFGIACVDELFPMTRKRAA
jgi:transcriptional regulator with XRE-family HTH domain